MKKKKHVISRVLPGSIGEDLELEPGDILAEINHQLVEDVFDYRYLMNDEYIELLIEKANGELWELEVEKDYDEDLGIEFENGLMDDYRSCSNHCMFCFIDQMPPGMRETLYFKDDDSRLSFLQGNYVTLTNMSQEDIERVIKYHLSPINVSFQAMNPQLRCKMLHNRFAGDALKKVDQLYEAGITMNGQIVLCKGVNDGEELEYSLQKMSEYAPVLQSVSVVPVGLTKFRKGLYPLEPFTKEDAKAVLEQIHRWQKIMYERYGIHFIHASDEWYILAGEELPEEDRYDGYLQLENGVGMLRNLQDEFDWALEDLELPDAPRKVTIPTGEGGCAFLNSLLDGLRRKCHNIIVDLVPVHNDFFGGTVNVTGLLTGQDLLKNLKGRDLGDQVLLATSMMKAGEDVFLDDMTREELSAALGVPACRVGNTGEALVRAVCGLPQLETPGCNPYEGSWEHR